jgi:heme iron utilization protein
MTISEIWMDTQNRQHLSQLIRNQQIAALGTLDDKQPVVSMVAYTVAGDFSCFYIHISGLAKHTRHIAQNPRVGLMICETLKPGQDPQTLARVSVTGEARVLVSGSGDYAEVKAGYLKKYPDSEISFGLGDFDLYAIEVEHARFVAGFGKTFNLTVKGMSDASRD